MNHILSFIPSDPMRLVACAEAVLIVVLPHRRSDA